MSCLRTLGVAPKIVDVTEPDWSALSHAYGAADDLPEILNELTPDSTSTVWGELWSRVCHQGTTYSASPYVLPALLESAQSWEVAGRAMPLALAGDIVASADFNIEGFEQIVSDLGRLAHETASAPSLSRSDRVYIMSSAVVFAGDPDWGQELIHLQDEEFVGCCPSCEVEFFLTIGELGCFVSEEDPVQGDASREEIVPCENTPLDGFREWVHSIAVGASDDELAMRIRCIFGQSRCPSCGKLFQVAEAIERFWRS